MVNGPNVISQRLNYIPFPDSNNKNIIIIYFILFTVCYMVSHVSYIIYNEGLDSNQLHASKLPIISNQN